MAEEQSGRDGWLKTIATHLLASFLSVIATLFVIYYTQTSPNLRYTIFPSSLYKAENKSLSIYNAQIENSGTEEAEDVSVSFIFPMNATPSSHNLEPSSKAIKYRIESKDKTNVLKDAIFHFPLLNPEESIKFSFLTENRSGEGEQQNIKIELRAKGVVGEEREIREASDTTLIYSLMWMTIFIPTLLWVMATYRFSRTISIQKDTILSQNDTLLSQDAVIRKWLENQDRGSGPLHD